MPQLHLYVPARIAEEISRRAESRGLSVSRFLSEIVRRELSLGWPEGYFEDVVGAWEGEPLERPDQGSLERRDDL